MPAGLQGAQVPVWIYTVGGAFVRENRGRAGRQLSGCLSFNSGFERKGRFVNCPAHQRLGVFGAVRRGVAGQRVHMMACGSVIGRRANSRTRGLFRGRRFRARLNGDGLFRPHKTINHPSFNKLIRKMHRNDVAFTQIRPRDRVVAFAVKLDNILAHRFCYPLPALKA